MGEPLVANRSSTRRRAGVCGTGRRGPVSRHQPAKGTALDIPGRDVCPLLPAASETVTGEEREILRNALFAVGGSRFLLPVDEPSPRVHLDGYGGPVLYDIDRDEWAARHESVGVRVSWRIVERTTTEAVVEIQDSSGSMAGGGQKVYLRKAGSRWAVVGRVPTWVS